LLAIQFIGDRRVVHGPCTPLNESLLVDSLIKRKGAAEQGAVGILRFGSVWQPWILCSQGKYLFSAILSGGLLTRWPVQFRNCQRVPPQLRISNLHSESTRVAPGKVIGNLDVELGFVSKCPKNQRFLRTLKT
jgi:hypothetical protein